MSVTEIWASLPPSYVEAWAGVVFLVLVGKATKSESRLLMAGVAACLVAPHAASLFAVGILGVALRAFDFINLPTGGN